MPREVPSAVDRYVWYCARQAGLEPEESGVQLGGLRRATALLAVALLLALAGVCGHATVLVGLGFVLGVVGVGVLLTLCASKPEEAHAAPPHPYLSPDSCALVERLCRHIGWTSVPVRRLTWSKVFGEVHTCGQVLSEEVYVALEEACSLWGRALGLLAILDLRRKGTSAGTQDGREVVDRTMASVLNHLAVAERYPHAWSDARDEAKELVSDLRTLCDDLSLRVAATGLDESLGGRGALESVLAEMRFEDDARRELSQN